MNRPSAAGRRPALRCALAAWIALVVTLFATGAHAHEAGLSRGEYQLDGAEVTAVITFARGDLASIVEGLDADGDGALSAGELERAREPIAKGLVARVAVSAGGAACAGALDAAQLEDQDGVTLRARFRCDAAPREASVEMRGLFEALPQGHRHLARKLVDGPPSDLLLSRRNHVFSLPNRAPSSVTAAAPKEEKSAPREGSVLGFFPMGIEHILLGYDHLVFLLGLVIVGGTRRSLFFVVTAFTLAHSISLALAALSIWAPSPRVVEPAIALSIAYVGVENFFVKDAAKRWRITLPFGLIHGFGFAGALAEVAVPRADVPLTLVLFNLGVEAGQLAVLALALPLVLWLRKQPWFLRFGVKGVNAAIVAAGLVWFVSRAFGKG